MQKYIIILIMLIVSCCSYHNSNEPLDVQQFRDEMGSADKASCVIQGKKTICDIDDSGVKSEWICRTDDKGNMTNCHKE